MRGCRINESQACRLRPGYAAQPKEKTMARYDERARDALEPGDVFAALPARAKRLPRYSPQVEKTPRTFDESYQRFAY